MDADGTNSLGLRRRSVPRRGQSSVKKEEVEEEVESDENQESEDDDDDNDGAMPYSISSMKGRKRKIKRSSGLVKRGRIGKHRMILRHYGGGESYPASQSVRVEGYEKPLRRSKREKRLLFATFNVSQMDKQNFNAAHGYHDDLSEDEMDPYEKLLSPRRSTRRSARLNQVTPPMSITGASKASGNQSQGDDNATVKEEGTEAHGEEEEEEEEEEETEEDEDEGEEVCYNLRKRQPVIYHFQPVQHVVDDDTPPKNRRGRKRRDSSYHSKARSAAPRAYQNRRTSRGEGKSTRKRQAHHDSSTTSSECDSDEARFRHRKARSMAKARSQCLPMNFTSEDLTKGVIRDRVRIGASLADINPMNIDRSVTFDSIGGLKQHIRALKEMIIFPLLYPEVFDRFQINPPRGVLFHGPPGCGKTLVARALANEVSKGGKKVAFFMRKGADCLSKWVGESERQLRLLFDQAYQVRPSIIFFDEIDGLAPVRSSRQDQIHSSIVSTLLALMDGLDNRGEIVVIGATNRIDTIDPALRRPGRFDREFIFPLPSRQDRHSILSIHTNGWKPRIKDEFLAELANSTIGYCGADLRALCTEAALFALRRRYPQIYNTTEKLVLDMTKINVTASDFHNALKSIVPTTQRSDSPVGISLPEHVRDLFLQSLSSLLSLISFIFPPSWKLVCKAANQIEMLLAEEEAIIYKIKRRVDELKGTPVLYARDLDNVLSADKKGRAIIPGSVTVASQFDKTSFKSHHHKNRTVTSTAVIGKNHVNFVPSQVVNSSAKPLSEHSHHKRRETPSPVSSPYSQLFQKQSQSKNLGNIFFDLSEVSCEDQRTGNGSDQQRSILVDEGTSDDPNLKSVQFLNFSSHPHIPPAVYNPRLVLCGKGGMGQSSYLGPALLHALEDLPVKTMDLSTIFGSSSRSPEEACTQILRELTRVTPSILFLPRLDSWWDVTPETFQMTFLSCLSSLPPSTPLLVLATAECPWQQLPERLRSVFMDTGSRFFTVRGPSLNQRKKFFYKVLLEKPFQPPPPKPLPLSDVPLEELPVASPPRPRELSADELNWISRQREAVLRELRVFLRDATNKLLAERKFKEFVKPVNSDMVPDYHSIIAQPMDLSTIMKKIDERSYTVPKQWIADVELIAKNALEYNPEHDSESRLLRHRAVALQDMAHSFLDHELSEDFEKQCEEIATTFERIASSQLMECTQTNTSSTSIMSLARSHVKDESADSAFKSDLYDARRRSLRQKGLGPEGKGFPYYSPPKQRALKCPNSQISVDQESSDDRFFLNPTHDYYTNGDKTAVSNSSSSQSQNSLGAEEQDCKTLNARRQIMRPWEDIKPTNAKNNSQFSGKIQNGHLETRSPNDSLCEQDGKHSHKVKDTYHRPNSVQTAAEALVAMATPKKSDWSSFSDVEMLTDSDTEERTMNKYRRSSVDRDTIRKRRGSSVDKNIRKRRGKSVDKDIRRKRGSSVDKDLICKRRNSADKYIISRREYSIDRDKRGTSVEKNRVNSHRLKRASTSPRNSQVVVDGRGLADVFEKIVMGTDSCSVEELERVHTVYEHLVFRHRMSWERTGLLEDLQSATNLFLQEFGVSCSQ